MSEFIHEFLELVKEHGVMVTLERACKLVKESRNTFRKNYVDTQIIPELKIPGKKRALYSLWDVLKAPDELKKRNLLQSGKRIPKSRADIDTIFRAVDKEFERKYTGRKVV